MVEDESPLGSYDKQSHTANDPKAGEKHIPALFGEQYDSNYFLDVFWPASEDVTAQFGVSDPRPLGNLPSGPVQGVVLPVQVQDDACEPTKCDTASQLDQGPGPSTTLLHHCSVPATLYPVPTPVQGVVLPVQVQDDACEPTKCDTASQLDQGPGPSTTLLHHCSVPATSYPVPTPVARRLTPEGDEDIEQHTRQKKRKGAKLEKRKGARLEKRKGAKAENRNGTKREKHNQGIDTLLLKVLQNFYDTNALQQYYEQQFEKFNKGILTKIVDSWVTNLEPLRTEASQPPWLPADCTHTIWSSLDISSKL
jgi:hypothetical protein